MIRRRTGVLLALGLLAPLALVDSPAGAIDQDLVASVTAGPPGTAIEVSSASCAGESAEDGYLTASLYVGTAPNQQIAAYGTGAGAATLTVPDWVDPDQPAVIEAACDLWSENGNPEFLEYDPIAFDIEPGSGTPVQVRTFSRTELLAGQGLTVTGSCGPTLGDAFVFATVFGGTDQTGKQYEVGAGRGFTQAEGDGAFELPVILRNSFIGISIEDDGSTVTDISVEEEPMDIPVGDYTAFVYCTTDDDIGSSLQFLEPQPIEVTGSAPTAGMELTNLVGSREVSLTGTCDAGDVTGFFEGIDRESIVGDVQPDPAGREAVRFQTSRSSGGARGAFPGLTDQVRGPGGSNRLIADGDYVEFDATTGADGAWQATDVAGFDQGIVIGAAACGDPMADGYVYDGQGVEIDAAVEPTTSVPPTVPVTTPYAPPASVVQGTPTYAG